MASRQWFIARGSKPEGPVSDERVREMIADGSVRPDTLIWCEGMTNWAKAADIPGLMAAPQRSVAPPSRPMAAPATAVAGDYSGHTLSTDVGVWPLFGRFVLLVIAEIVIIPLPWVATSFFRWFVDHIELPGRERVAFAGRAGQIWWVFILYALFNYVGLVRRFLLPEDQVFDLVQLVTFLITPLFTLLIARWFYRNLVWQGQTTALHFTGGYWAMLGWTLLLVVSFITIIGWAWVATAWSRWLCRHVKGSVRQFAFIASGWSYLWRTVVLGVASAFLIPIPWVMRWYVRWLVSQFALI